jgi:hypothetical protein
VCLLVGIGDPRTGIRAAPPVDRTGEGACLGDVEVAAFRRLVTQRQIGFASREVCRLSRLDQFQGDAGRKRRRCRSRQAASQKPSGTLAGRYPHRTAQHRRGRRRHLHRPRRRGPGTQAFLQSHSASSSRVRQCERSRPHAACWQKCRISQAAAGPGGVSVR